MTDSSAALATLDIVRQTRRSMAAIVDALPQAARTAIPDGFNNHVLWNVGHVVATERGLTYSLSGLPTGLPDGFVDAFKKGSSPREWDREWAYEEVRDLLLSLPDQTQADLRAGRFASYSEYRTTPGVVLASAEDAIRFNLYHEGLHLGSILALRKLVS